MPAATTKRTLFESPNELPQGMRYGLEVISREVGAGTAQRASRALPIKEFEFRGFLGKRRVVSFGWHYDFNGGGLGRAGAIPKSLLPIRGRAARFAGIEPASLEHTIVIEYAPGAAIGWHRDRPTFEDVIGISLLAPCTFRLRLKVGAKWERHSFTAEPRSAYLLRGSSRTEWEHSIPPVETLRYSITFRSLSPKGRRP